MSVHRNSPPRIAFVAPSFIAGNLPVSNVMLDADGNLYATASPGDSYNAGVVFEITPN
jgi:hypothetical protein